MLFRSGVLTIAGDDQAHDAALREVASGLSQAAPSANGGDAVNGGDAANQDNAASPFESGRYWGKATELMVLKSREQAIFRVLKDIVPAYDPLKPVHNGGEEGVPG